ncbi:hypothetical protein MCERE155_00023 [Candidatus Nanopelagicaceae bacterium]
MNSSLFKMKAPPVICLFFNWVLLQILTHFFPNLDFMGFALIFLVVNYSAFLLVSFQEVLFKPIPTKWILLYLSTYFTSIVLMMVGTKISFEKPYVIFSHLGAGTLFDDDGVSLFGDLVHITSAAKCDLPVQVGQNICDIWQRSFNQNPQVVDLFRILQLTNVFLVGVVSTIAFLYGLYLLSWKLQIQNLAWVFFLASPPLILALDRGNEIITLLLIIPAIFLLRLNDKLIWVSTTLLSIATFFKFWPILLLICLAIFSSRFRRHFLFATLIMCCYWTLRLETLREMNRSTMKGSLDGLSFGLKILSYTQYSFLVKLTMVGVAIFLVLSMLKWFTQSDYIQLRESLKSNDDYPYVVSIFLSYIVLWIATDSYIYRLILFIPVVILLTSSRIIHLAGAQKFLALLLMVFYASRSQVSWVFTASLMLLLLVRVIRSFSRVPQSAE